MRSLGGPRTAILASLMMMGLMPISNATLASEPDPRRIPPPVPHSPTKREPPPLTPEQIKAAEKRTRKAKRLAKESNDGTQ